MSQAADPFKAPSAPLEDALDPDDPELIGAQLAFAELRKILLFVAGMNGVGTLLALLAGQLPGIIAGLVSILVYVGLWAWSKRSPLPAVVLGLILYIPAVLGALVSGSLMVLLLSGVVVVALIRGIRTASKLRRIQARVRAA